MEIIKVSDVRMAFDEKEVLKGINFGVSGGEIFGFLGPSGAGKTTLIKIITGQLKATSGECQLFGVKSEKLTMRERRRIGIMMDDLGLYERLSCYDNLKVFADLYKIGGEQIKKTLSDVGLAECANLSVHKLSKGMKNRLRLARAFLTDPDVLFLDEPTSGLDPATMEEIHGMIEAKKAAGKTVFLTTHNMSEASKLCDEIALLDLGEIVESGSPDGVCRKYDHLKQLNIRLIDGREFSFPSSPESAPEISKLLSCGLIQTIHSSEPDLEKVFIELTGNKLD